MNIKYTFICLLGFLMVLSLSCKKDSVSIDPLKPQSISYSKIDRNYILKFSSYLKSHDLYQNSPTEVNFDIASTILFKTDLGNYGKMKIKDIYNNNGLTIKLDYVVYKEDGSILIEKVDFILTINKYLDLDTGTLVNQSAEFSWASSGGIYRLYMVSSDVLVYLYAQ